MQKNGHGGWQCAVKSRADCRAYYEARREQQVARCRTYREAHRQERRDYMVTYRANHAEEGRAYRLEKYWAMSWRERHEAQLRSRRAKALKRMAERNAREAS
jgi:hypothetical protein